MNKKGQHIAMSTMILLMIFMGALTFVLTELQHNPKESQDIYTILSREASRIASNMLREGYPQDWDTTNIRWLGLCENTILNETKVTYAQTLPYETIRTSTNTLYDVFIVVNETETIGTFATVEEFFSQDYPTIIRERRVANTNTGEAVTIDVYIYTKKVLKGVKTI